jgi:hypothetical protein
VNSLSDKGGSSEKRRIQARFTIAPPGGAGAC